jgi:type I restriction enzyme S subunit
MNEWKTFTLGKDVVTKLGDGLHGTPIYDENGDYYFINGSNLVEGKIVINSNTKKVTEEEFIKYKKELSDKTILLGINGTIGNVALYNNEKCILGKSAAYLNVNDDFDKNFIRYVLTNKHFQNYIKNNASGTTIKNVGLGLLREYEFSAPEDKTKQQQISQILTSLDDKIGLNLQMNQTLEAMAQAIFKDWFINFNFQGFDGELVNGLPKGWNYKTIGELGKVITGSTPSSKNPGLFGSEIPFVTPTDFKNFGKLILDASRYLSIEGKQSMKTRLLPSNSVIVTCIGSDMGKVAINRVECVTNQQINSIIPNRKLISSDYLFYDLVYKYDYLRNIATGGSTMPIINKSRFEEIEILVPKADILVNFQNLMDSFNYRIEENVRQINSLTQTRDTLLPKLMSGHIAFE